MRPPLPSSVSFSSQTAPEESTTKQTTAITSSSSSSAADKTRAPDSIDTADKKLLWNAVSANTRKQTLSTLSAEDFSRMCHLIITCDLGSHTSWKTWKMVNSKMRDRLVLYCIGKG